jgi:adenosylcobinamide-GDP ribazoletransferase
MAWGRWSIPVMLALLPPVSHGLASEVHQGMGRKVLPAATVLAGMASWAAWRFAGPVAGAAWNPGSRLLWQPALAALVTVLAWSFYLRHRLGGQSGDLLGAGNQLVEAVVLLTLLAGSPQVARDPWAACAQQECRIAANHPGAR